MTNVDLDRLADYVGGALDGTPDAAAVAHLVATEPHWARAHAELVAADVAVRADLGVLAAAPEPMPAAVFDRLEAALAAASRSGTHPPGRPDEHAPGTPPARSDAPGPADTRPAGRAAHRRRRRRTIALTAVAALVLFGVGASVALPQLLSNTLTASSGKRAGTAAEPDNAGSAAGAQPQIAASGPPGLAVSGMDYNRDTVRASESRPAAGGEITQPKPGAQSDRTTAPQLAGPAADAVPDALRRLIDVGALSACLNAVTAEYGGHVTAVDYARFQGSPALVIAVDGAFGTPGRRWVVVVGPRCGEGGAIADEVYNTATN